MKYLKQYESNASVNPAQYYECMTDAIKIISTILNMMAVDFDARYDADTNLNGISEDNNRIDFDFNINGFNYSIVVDPHEVDNDEDDFVKYDGCNLSTYFFTLDENDPEYEMDAISIECGRDILNMLIKLKGNPWITQINESNNTYDWSCTSEAIDISTRILSAMNIDYKKHLYNKDTHHFTHKTHYDPDGIVVNELNGQLYFKIDDTDTFLNVVILANRLRYGYDGSDITVKLQITKSTGLEQFVVKNGAELYHKLTSITGESLKWIKKINGVDIDIKERNQINMKYINNFKLFEKKNTFVNTNSFDLEKWYTKLNKQFFGGKLKKVPLKWNQAKKELGVVKWDEKSGKIEHLAISDKFELTEAETLSVLAHEMIHVWQVQNKKTDGHGNNFKKEMDRINDKSKWGIKVLTKQPLSHLKTTNPDLDKDYGFIIIKNNKTDFDIAIFNPGKTDYKNILNIIKQNIKGSKKIDIEVRSTQNGTVKQYKKESTNKTLNTYKLDEVTFDTLMSDSKKIYGSKIGK